MRKLKIKLAWECLVGVAITYISISFVTTYEGSVVQVLPLISVFIYALLSAIASILEIYKKVLEEELKEKRIA